MPDMLRREPRNIGVIVRDGDAVSAKFLGETAPGVVDRRRTSKLNAPDVYLEWVYFWRDELAKGAGGVEGVLKESYGNYFVIEGGHIGDAGADSTDAVAEKLFVAMVTDAISAPQKKTFSDEVEDAFGGFDLLSVKSPILFPPPPHPIHRKQTINGFYAQHNPDFLQHNGHTCVMETVDARVMRRQRLRERAGYTASMFEDLVDRDKTIETIAIFYRPLQISDELAGIENILQRHADSVVNWADQDQRKEFLKSRSLVARGEPNPTSPTIDLSPCLA